MTRLEKEERPRSLRGRKTRMDTGVGRAYIGVTWKDDHPFEVFVDIGKAGSDVRAEAEGIARLCSLALRAGVKADDIIDQLKEIKGTPVWHQSQLIFSLEDAVAKVLQEHVNLGPPETWLDMDELAGTPIPEGQRLWIDDWAESVKSPGPAGTGPYSLSTEDENWAVALSGSTMVAVRTDDEYPALHEDFRARVWEAMTPEGDPDFATTLYYLRAWVVDTVKDVAHCPTCESVTYCKKCLKMAAKEAELGWIGRVLINKNLLESVVHHFSHVSDDDPIGIWGGKLDRKPCVFVKAPTWSLALMGINDGLTHADLGRLGDVLEPTG